MPAEPADRRRAKRTALTAIAAFASVALVGSCAAQTVGGTAVPLGPVNQTDVAGLPVTNGPSGPKPGVTDASVPVHNTDGGATDQLAANAVFDVQRYWQRAFASTFDAEFPPLRRLVSYDSRTGGVRVCGSDARGVSNAFYCPADDSVAWDRGNLLPGLTRSFGPAGVLTVLAHEMGHAVQHKLGDLPPNTPTIVLEQQADCYAGAFFRHAAEGKAPHFRVSTGDGLNQAMSALFFIRDPAGSANFTNENAHGTAFDRVTAFQLGFADGPRRCTTVTPEEVRGRVTEFQFWKPEQEQDLGIDARGVRAVVDSLRGVFATGGAASPEVIPRLVPCADARQTTPVTYCPSSNTVGVDMPALQRQATTPRQGGDGVGDFAAYAELASRYVQVVQRSAGMTLDDANAGLRTACLVGSWSGQLVEDPIGERNPAGKLRLAPGDLDEGVAALLGERSIVAANVNGDTVPSGFARVSAFRNGFEHGPDTCTRRYDS